MDYKAFEEELLQLFAKHGVRLGGEIEINLGRNRQDQFIANGKSIPLKRDVTRIGITIHANADIIYNWQPTDVVAWDLCHRINGNLKNMPQ